MLRDYQQRTINQLYEWFGKNKGNPCLVLPTGSGKSHIVAALCKDAVQKWPETKILMLTHVKELIEQNAEKMRQHWLGAPLGIYSAGIGKRDLGEPITFAGIQSVRTKSAALGHIDLVIVDECHLISHKNEGGYRTLLDELKVINPELRVIGLTATPYRLGHGLITDKPAIFDDLIEPVSIEELIYKRHLATLRVASSLRPNYKRPWIQERITKVLWLKSFDWLVIESHGYSFAQVLITRKTYQLSCATKVLSRLASLARHQRQTESESSMNLNLEK